jgi:hypothetical protein
MIDFLREKIRKAGISGCIICLGSLASDFFAPLGSWAKWLALASLFGLIISVILAFRFQKKNFWHETAFMLGVSTIGFSLTWGLQTLQDDPTRGVLANQFAPIERVQSEILGIRRSLDQVEGLLRELLERGSNITPLAEPRSANEFLFNAILLSDRDQPSQAASALMESLKRNPTPRPDALLLYEQLRETRLPGVLRALATLPADLAQSARAYLEATSLTLSSERIAALGALTQAYPNFRIANAAFAQALATRAATSSLTISKVRRAVDAAERHLAEPGYSDFVETFLRPSSATQLRAQSERVIALRSFSNRYLVVNSSSVEQEVIRVSITVPETAMRVEWQHNDLNWNQLDRDGGGYSIRLLAPWRPTEFRIRYADAEGVLVDPITWQFDPTQTLRLSALRSLQRLNPFEFYFPVRRNGKVNDIFISKRVRQGASAIEWFTDTDRRPRSLRIGVSDEQLLLGNVADTSLALDVPTSARTLFLAAILYDGSRNPVRELPIR